MALTKSETTEITKKYGKNGADTGAPEVQIALLTKRLDQLTAHFETNKKDHHSRYGLLKLVGQRRRLLNYLHKKDAKAYKSLIEQLGIRK